MGWLKKLKKGSTFEKQYFIIDGETVKYFKENHEDGKVTAPELTLASLMEVRVPSTAPGAAGQGFDLVFSDQDMTCLEDDTPDSRRFSMMMKKLHPRPREAGALTTTDGESMLVIECESCGTLQAIQANAKRAKCIQCRSKLDMLKAAHPEEIELHTVQCGWCSQWLQYPSAAHEVQCANCRNVLNLREKGSGTQDDAGDSGKGLEKYKKMVAKLTKHGHRKDKKITMLETEVTKLKKELELLQGGTPSTRRVTTRKKKKNNFGGGGDAGHVGSDAMPEADEVADMHGAAAEHGLDVSAIVPGGDEEVEAEAVEEEEEEEAAAAAEEEGEYASVWEVHTDEEGQVFYHNPETDETDWDPPAEILRPGFVKHTDEDDGSEFYHNDATDESEWEAPLIEGLKHVGPDDE